MIEKNETPRAGVALIGAGMIAKTHVAALSAARERVRLEALTSQRLIDAIEASSRDGVPVDIAWCLQ